MTIRYLHTMVRVLDLEKSIAFYRLLGLEETRRYDNEGGRFTLVFMAPPGQPDCPVELTWNWDGDTGLPSDSRHFGHLLGLLAALDGAVIRRLRVDDDGVDPFLLEGAQHLHAPRGGEVTGEEAAIADDDAERHTALRRGGELLPRGRLSFTGDASLAADVRFELGDGHDGSSDDGLRTP